MQSRKTPTLYSGPAVVQVTPYEARSSTSWCLTAAVVYLAMPCDGEKGTEKECGVMFLAARPHSDFVAGCVSLSVVVIHRAGAR